jgi:uncharacterized protein (TIGR00369 family)
MSKRREDELRHMFHEAPIARTLGLTLTYDEEGQAVVELPYNPGLDHIRGGVHGGVYATMLDTAGWFTCAAARESDAWLTTAEMSIHFLSPAEHTRLRAVGRVIKAGKRQDVAEMYLYDGEDHLVGHATGTFIILPNVPLAPAEHGSGRR